MRTNRRVFKSVLCAGLMLGLTFPAIAADGKSENSADWFYPKEVAEAKYNVITIDFQPVSKF